MNIAIIIITFNRPESLKRLLKSIDQAKYPHHDISLIFSIDYQDSVGHEQVVDIANTYQWSHGEKITIEHSENLGLRNHVISCGNLSENYDGIIMLEDDIYVAPYFYSYTLQMFKAYGDKPYVSGVSLYNHERNPNIDRPFRAMKNEYDVYFLQYAQSWGQAWTKGMWAKFYTWYKENRVWDDKDLRLPEFVLIWPNSSWLKYFIKYLVITDTYFAYPYISLTTNFQDQGTHSITATNVCQVSLNIYNSQYNLPSIKNSIIYDVFFERKDHEFISFLDKSEDILVDLYGCKKNYDNKKYWLSTKDLPYKVEKFYGLNLKPHELNIILENDGEQIFLYNTKYASSIRKNNLSYTMFKYDYNVEPRKAIKYIIDHLINKIF